MDPHQTKMIDLTLKTTPEHFVHTDYLECYGQQNAMGKIPI